MFWMYPVTGVYFYGKHLSSTQKDKLINAFTSYNAALGITENHTLMYNVSMYLMSGEDKKNIWHWFNQKTSSENHAHAAFILKALMDQSFATGFSEFNSPHYSGFYFAPLLLLYDFSKDKEIKSHAEILLWRLFADYITHYHFEVIVGAASRTTDPDVFNKRSSTSANLMAFLLGNRVFSQNYHELFFALSSFKFPDSLHEVWKEQQKRSFEEIDLERTMPKLPPSDHQDEAMTTYLYTTPHYSLGSLIAGHDDEIQMRTWSLDWAGSGKNNTLFGLNPFFSEKALGTYFPDIDKAYPEILKQRPNYEDSNKWIGGSPYETLFQHKNVLLGIYNFPDGEINNSVSFYLSNDIVSSKLENNVLMAKTESIYFAVRFSEVPEISDADFSGKRYRITGEKPAFILEVYPATIYTSLNDFSIAMNSETASFSSKKVRYQGTDGKQMQLNADGKKHLNRKTFKVPANLIYKSPFMNIANGMMTIQTNKVTAILDWNKKQITSKNH